MGKPNRQHSVKNRILASEAKRKQSSAWNKPTTRKIIDRAAVARSLIELEKLFGRKPPDTNGNARLQSGAGETGKQTRGAT